MNVALTSARPVGFLGLGLAIFGGTSLGIGDTTPNSARSLIARIVALEIPTALAASTPFDALRSEHGYQACRFFDPSRVNHRPDPPALDVKTTEGAPRQATPRPPTTRAPQREAWRCESVIQNPLLTLLAVPANCPLACLAGSGALACTTSDRPCKRGSSGWSGLSE